MMDTRLHFEAQYTSDESATFALIDGHTVAVSVAEEKAMDSYNRMFDCTMHLGQSQAEQLRDWLIAHFPP